VLYEIILRRVWTYSKIVSFHYEKNLIATTILELEIIIMIQYVYVINCMHWICINMVGGGIVKLVLNVVEYNDFVNYLCKYFRVLFFLVKHDYTMFPFLTRLIILQLRKKYVTRLRPNHFLPDQITTPLRTNLYVYILCIIIYIQHKIMYTIHTFYNLYIHALKLVIHKMHFFKIKMKCWLS
jgi:hypothetical protein